MYSPFCPPTSHNLQYPHNKNLPLTPHEHILLHSHHYALLQQKPCHLPKQLWSHYQYSLCTLSFLAIQQFFCSVQSLLYSEPSFSLYYKIRKMLSEYEPSFSTHPTIIASNICCPHSKAIIHFFYTHWQPINVYSHIPADLTTTKPTILMSYHAIFTHCLPLHSKHSS